MVEPFLVKCVHGSFTVTEQGSNAHPPVFEAGCQGDLSRVHYKSIFVKIIRRYIQVKLLYQAVARLTDHNDCATFNFHLSLINGSRMTLSCLRRLIIFLVIFSSGCVAADVHDVADKTPSSGAPYVSRLNEPQSNAYYHYMRARMLLAEGDLDEAVAAYQTAIDYAPNDEAMRFELAELHLDMERPEQAVRAIEDVLLRNPDSVRANMALGNAYFANRQPEKAAPYFRRVLELEPDNEEVHLRLAIALVRMGEIDQASQHLKELLRLNPESRPGRLAMARLYRETGLNQLAVEEYRMLIRQDPDLDQASLELGLLYEELEEWQNALDVFAGVLEQRPLDFNLRHHLARVYIGMKRYDDALEELNIIVDLKPDDFEARRKIGLIYLEQKRWADAIMVFRAILDLNPHLEPVRYYLGSAYERLSEWDLALEAFEGIDKESALYDDALSHIGFIYLENDRIDEAITLLESRKASGTPRPQIYHYLASLYMANDQHEKAISVVEEGVQRYPDNIELLYQKGLVLERSGLHEEAGQAMKNVLVLDDQHAEALNFLAYAYAVENRHLDEALEYAERAVKRDPAPHILDTLGWVYYRLGRFTDALKVIEEASRQLSEDAVVFEHLGDIHLALGNREEARTAFERALQLQPDNIDLRDKLENLSDQ